MGHLGVGLVMQGWQGWVCHAGWAGVGNAGVGLSCRGGMGWESFLSNDK